MALTDKLSAIGDAIRAKTGGTDMLTLDQMPTAIAGIQTGSGSGGDYNIIVTNNSDGTQSFAITDASGSSGGSGFWDEDYAKQIIEGTFTEIIWPSGVTSINGKIFYDNDNLTNVTLPNTLVFIGSSVFSSCSNLKITTIPAGVTTIGGSAFSNCVSIQTLDILGGPNIGVYAFDNCTGLTQVIYRGNGEKIYNYAFNDCTGLTSVTFKGTLSEISSNAFYGCTNLTNIYVPWAEGAVAGAPWGATNATIHYNTTT